MTDKHMWFVTNIQLTDEEQQRIWEKVREVVPGEVEFLSNWVTELVYAPDDGTTFYDRDDKAIKEM